MSKEEQLRQIFESMKEKGHFQNYRTYEAWREKKKKKEETKENDTKSKTYDSFRRGLSKEEEDDFKNIFGE